MMMLKMMKQSTFIRGQMCDGWQSPIRRGQSRLYETSGQLQAEGGAGCLLSPMACVIDNAVRLAARDHHVPR